MKRFLCLMVMLLAWPSVASAMTVDGTLKAGYFGPVAVQDTPTQFGDNQSELNAAYARLDKNGNLSLLLTGNLQNNGNGLILFIDSRAGGAVAETVGAGFGKLNSVGGARIDDWGNDTDGGAGVSPTPGGASILDPGFNPDLALEINAGDGGNPTSYYTNIVDMTVPNEPNDNRDIYLGVNTFGAGSSTPQSYNRADSDPAKGHGGTIAHAFNNSNTAGVTDSSAATALTATTGYEALISSGFLANDGQRIKIMAFITNGDGGYLSNQFLGETGLAGAGNIGAANDPTGTPLFDAQTFAGNQFITVPIAGDFNHDGQVDARDFVLWQKADGSTENYDTWRAQFGNAAAAAAPGGLAAASVPEAGTLTLVGVGLALVGFLRRR